MIPDQIASAAAPGSAAQHWPGGAMLHADPTNNKNIFASTNKVVMFFKCRGGVIDEFVHSPTKAANSFVNVMCTCKSF